MANAREVPKFDEKTEAALDHLASVSASDIEAAKALWRQDAPRAYKGLLDGPKAEPKR